MFIRITLMSALFALAVAGTLGSPAAGRAQSGPDFGSVSGQWLAHGLVIDIGSDGQADAHWRIYTWCNTVTQPAPCDSMDGNAIVDGGMAMLRLTSMSGNTANVLVLESTDPSFLAPGSTVTLQFNSDGTAQLSAVPGPATVCGPNFNPDVTPGLPCGA